jgi:hypothetical protein
MTYECGFCGATETRDPKGRGWVRRWSGTDLGGWSLVWACPGDAEQGRPFAGPGR